MCIRDSRQLAQTEQEIAGHAHEAGQIAVGRAAGGVGLFRTEFVYLNCKDFPTEDYQFEAYKQVLESLAPRKVVVRTCDIGADKTVDYMKLDHEENPALGYRAIRICLTRKDFFKTCLLYTSMPIGRLASPTARALPPCTRKPGAAPALKSRAVPV